MKKNVEKGDLLKTNPLDGYWVCTMVLGTRDKTSDFDAMCHIATTNAVFDHDFEVSEINVENIRIIHVENYEGKVVPCIETYASKLKNGVDVIGNIEPTSYYSELLDFKIGNGSDGGWPHCGPLKKSLGYQAVHQWRKVNNKEAWLKEIDAAEKTHKEMLKRLKHGS